METEAEVAGQTFTSRSRAKRSRASISSAVPPDAFQIPLEKIDGLREVQNQHTERMTAMQDQLDVLSAKFDSIYTNQEHWPFGHSGQKGGDNFQGAVASTTSKGECLFEGEKFQKLFKFLFYFIFVFVLDNC